MLKELGFDYDKDVSLHHNPLSDQRVLGALRTAFNKVDEADREMEGPQIADLEKMAMTGNVEWGSNAANIFNREHKNDQRLQGFTMVTDLTMLSASFARLGLHRN